MNNKSISTVVMEATIIGILFIIMFMFLNLLNITNLNLKLFLSAFLFHIFCEITGLNIWYSKNYVDLLNKID
jgi:hypothetical protein